MGLRSQRPIILPPPCSTRSGYVPDRRRPGTLLDGLGDQVATTLLVLILRVAHNITRGVGRLAAIDPTGKTVVLIPPAARAFEHTGIVEGVLTRIEVGIRPCGTEVRGAPCLLARLQVY